MLSIVHSCGCELGVAECCPLSFTAVVVSWMLLNAVHCSQLWL